VLIVNHLEYFLALNIAENIMLTEANVGCAAIFVGLITFILTKILDYRQERRIANREIYQRLELAAIEIFRFDACQINTIKPLWDKNIAIPPKDTAEHIAFINYVCQILNLFEMIIRFRKERIIPTEIFESWISWFYSLSCAPHFPDVWFEVRWDYTKDLRIILNYSVSLSFSEPNEMKRRKDFYYFVSDLYNDTQIKHNYDRIENEINSIITLEKK